jgi:hypothetical protein
MAEQASFDNSVPEKDRRKSVPEPDRRNVTFAERKLSPERLQALQSFLTTASPDEIAMIRQTYADVPEVLDMISLELRK